MQYPAATAAKLALAACAVCASVAAQEPPPPAKPDPEIAASVDRLESAWKDRAMAHDDAAIAELQKLGKAAAAPLYKSDRRLVLSTTTAVLNKGKLRPSDACGIYEAAAEALVSFGADGAKALHTTYTRKRFPKKPEWARMRATLVSNIGKTRDLKMVDFLCERAKRAPEDEVLAAAGEALGNYQDADQKVRKKIVKALIAKLGGVEANASQAVVNQPGQPQNFGPQNAQQTLRAISGKWNASLQKLTGQPLKNGSDWQHWFNKNKTRDWDEADKDG
jgi:hypothetical protein